MKKAILTLAIFAMLGILLSIPTAFADYFDTGASTVISSNGTANVTGFVKLTNGTGIGAYLVNCTLNGTMNSTNTSSGGGLSVLVHAPTLPGDYNITCTTANATYNETIPIHVSNFTSANITFDGIQPPFGNGTNVIINVSVTGNGTIDPSLRIFKSYGAYMNWTVTNISAVNNTNGTLRYNISMPGDADGSYILSFEKGLAFRIFTVKSTLTIVGDILDSSNSSTTIIGRTESITLRARVYDSSGAINNSNVTGRITYPNGTSIPISFTLQNSTTGAYNFTFTDTASSGRYEISMVSNTGRNVSTSTVFDIGTVDAKLDTVKDTFFEFGSESGFAAGGQIAFNVLVANLSNNAIFSGSASNAIDRTICTNTSTTIFPIELKNQRTSNTLAFGTTNLTVGTGSFFGQTVCKINFTAPSETGIYSLKVNTTTNVSGVLYNATAVGYFQIQRYILKVAPVSTLGGGFEFLSSLRPGDNASFEIGARNLQSSGAAVTGSSITNVTFKRLQSLNFLRRESDITGLASNTTNGTSSSNPKIQIVLPENKTGPYQIEVQANVSGEIVTGTAFYFAKYIEGFAFPAGFYGGEGGPGGPEGGSSGFICNSTATFTVKTMDVKTRQAARNVVLNNIEAARSESSGQDVASYLSIASSTPSDSNGLANLTMNFSSNISYSGFYFFLVNITTDEGKADILPGGFECRNLNFFPSVSANGSSSGFSGGFNIAPSALININVSSIQNLRYNGNTTRNGTVTITRLRNFDVSKGGGSAYTPSSTLTYNLSNGSVSFVLGAGNFSGLTTWPNGFNDLEIQVTDNLTGGVLTTDSRGAFFRTVAFDVFAGFDFGTYTPGQVVTKEVYVRTNLTHNSTNASYTNTTDAGFTGKMGRPWEGSLVDLTVNGTLISDGWSSNADFGTERWNVSFTIPTSMRKGFNMIMITAKSNITNETATVEMPGQVNKYTVQVPDEEFFQMQNYGVQAVTPAHNQSIYTTYGINLSNMSQQWGVSSKSGGVCIAVNISVQRFGMGGSQTLAYSTRTASANVSAVVLDNGTAGIYDTLIINNSGNITVANANNRRFSNLTSNSNLTVLYLRNVMDCGFVSLLNSAANSTGFGSGFGGQHQASATSRIFIPFKVMQGTSVITGANMTAFQIIMQDTNGGSDGRGGFGFTGFLESTRYNFTNGTTDSNGIAFLEVRNISTSGSMNLIWKLDTGTDTDVAEFFNGVQFEVKSFKAWINLLEAPFRVVNLTNITTGAGPPGGNISAWANSTVTNAGFNVFNGTWDETAQGQLALDSNDTKVFYFVLRNVSAGSPGSFPTAPGDATTLYTDLIVDDDIDLNAGESPSNGNFTETSSNWTNNINFNGFSSFLKVMGNNTVSTSLMQIIIAQENRTDFKSLTPSGNSTRIDANVTIEICAYTYDRPERPVIGADITMTTEKFSPNGPPSNINLTIWNPFTNVNVTSVKTGPSGCAVFNVSHPTWSGNAAGWTAGQPNNLKAVVNNSGTTETAYGPPIMVMCPPGVRCYS